MKTEILTISPTAVADSGVSMTTNAALVLDDASHRRRRRGHADTRSRQPRDGVLARNSVYEDSVLAREYQYDANGNRLAVLDGVGAVIELGTFDDQDRMLSYGDSTYEYTANGELVTRETGGIDQTDYDYDVYGNLRSIMMPDGTVIEYDIDPGGRRIGRTVNGVTEDRWIWSTQLGLAAELDDGGVVTSRYVQAMGVNVPDYIIESGTTLRVVTDHLGSPRMLVDTTTGDVVAYMDYDEWGAVTRNDNPGAIPFGFAGGVYDPETELVRFGFRDYDAQVGRWTAKDPIGFGGGLNHYAYVGNEPVGRVDPIGLWYGYCSIDGMCMPNGDPCSNENMCSAAWGPGARGGIFCDEDAFEQPYFCACPGRAPYRSSQQPNQCPDLENACGEYERLAWRRDNNLCDPNAGPGPRTVPGAQDSDPIYCEFGWYLVLRALELCNHDDPCGEMACATVAGKLWTTMAACSDEISRGDEFGGHPWWTDFL